MADSGIKSSDTKLRLDRGHPLPRRATPDKSVTLRHHRLARDASTPLRAVPAPPSVSRRNSSSESHETRQSDPKRWFDRSNCNPTASLEANAMDVDPPFFQKETESSNEEMRIDAPTTSIHPYGPSNLPPTLKRLTTTHSSSADDYRSVIDDLTIENQRLKEELKRYKRLDTDRLKKDKLFEIKFHGLPRRQKRELEATLRDFAARWEGSSEAASQRRKSSKHANHMYSSGGSMSKHASSSSSQSRPVDSAYASMSTGQHSAGTSLPRPSISSRARSSEQKEKVEHYLEEIPEGLYPGFLPHGLTDQEKQKLVVKKLEHLFTGKITGRNMHRNQSMPSLVQMEPPTIASLAVPPSLEPSREAHIQEEVGKKSRSRDNLSISNSHSNGDQTESGGNGNGNGISSGSGSGAGSNMSPPTARLPEQRPTRPRDLDPDRVQIPSENMEYIRHLGLVPPELLAGSKARLQDVSPDAEGWVYLNLLSNLAQLHMLNVSPDFIRKAVSAKSAKFQLSPDGRKIRWRGGSEGTKFRSDSSGENSRGSASTDEDDDGSDKTGQRKRQKTGQSGDGFALGHPTKNRSKFGPRVSGASDGFQYKPLFVQQNSLETSADDTGSPDSYQIEESNNNSKWDYSGSGSSPRKKRRADGGIVFYSGAPFCTDLSGDLGDSSPTTYMTSTGQMQSSRGFDGESITRPLVHRTSSGASLPCRPLSDQPVLSTSIAEVDMDREPCLTDDETADGSSLDSEFPWCDEPETISLRPIESTLEASGVGRVFPDDHFAVTVTSRRPCNIHRKDNPNPGQAILRLTSDETTISITRRLAAMSASSPTSPRPTWPAQSASPVIEIEYLSARVRRLNPAPLPSPARFYPPFSTSSESGGCDMLGSEDEEDEDGEILPSSVEEVLSKRADLHHSDNDNTYPDAEELTSGDEEDEVDPDIEDGGKAPSRGSFHKRKHAVPLRQSRRTSGVISRKSADLTRAGSSAATAGGIESGYSSSLEDD